MHKLIAKQNKSYYYLINTVGKRVAIIVLSVLITMTSVTFGVSALRNAVIDFITETFEKFTTIYTDSPDTETEIKVKVSPQYIPDGYFEDFIINETTAYCITYKNNENGTVSYTQIVQSGTTYNANTEGIPFEKIKIKGYEGISFIKNGYSTVIFADNNYYYSIMGKLPMEEIIKMAESISLKK